MRFAVLVAAFATLLPALAARADEVVAQASDDEEPSQERAPAAPAAPPSYAPPAYTPPAPPPPPDSPPPESKLTGRTHIGLLPTGELPGAGKSELSMHDFMYATGAVGLSDSFEINFSMPIFPVFAQAGVRLGLAPRSSPLRLVVGANAWVPLFDEDAKTVYSGTVTVAYQRDRFNLHGTLMFFTNFVDEKAVGVTSVGAELQVGESSALYGEIAQVIGGDRESSKQLYASQLGIKFIGANVDWDLGLMMFHGPDEATDTTPLPTLSVTQRF